MEVRTWKTFTALETVKKYWAKKVLFLTKKKAISSIEEDYSHYKKNFNIVVINYEPLHKVEWKFDLLVLDESHGLWTYPKPNNKVTLIREKYWDLPMILLSWTPSPESYSQFFHQIFVKKNTVWEKYHKITKTWKNKWSLMAFYLWVKDFVKIKQIRTSYWLSNDYSNANYNKIMEDIWHLILTFTQEKAGFTTAVDEEVLYVKMNKSTYDVVKRLKKDKVIESKLWDILADTMVKEQQKVHQLFSWTIKFEDWSSTSFDFSKAEFIKKYFKWKKLWIFYKFKEEKILQKKTFWDSITDDLSDFNSSDRHIMLQIVSGREWISLKEADYLVFYNIDFSATSYWQARDRLTTMDRKNNKVYWIFAEWGLEDKIYESVLNKKNYTSKLYAKTN